MSIDGHDVPAPSDPPAAADTAAPDVRHAVGHAVRELLPGLAQDVVWAIAVAAQRRVGQEHQQRRRP